MSAQWIHQEGKSLKQWHRNNNSCLVAAVSGLRFPELRHICFALFVNGDKHSQCIKKTL